MADIHINFMRELMRCFVAIDIKKELLCLIDYIQKELREVDGRFSFILPETTHITLRFLGETDDKTLREVTTQLREVVKKHRPFELNTTNVGVFQRNGIAHIIWLGVELKTELQTLTEIMLDCPKPKGSLQGLNESLILLMQHIQHCWTTVLRPRLQELQIKPIVKLLSLA